MVRALLVKRHNIKLLKNIWYILLVLCSLLHIFHFTFNLMHTKTIENNNVWKRIEAGSGAGTMKKSVPEPELQSWKLSSRARAGATFMNRGAPEAELCHFYDSSAALFLSKHILEVSSVGCAPQCDRDSLGFG